MAIPGGFLIFSHSRWLHAAAPVNHLSKLASNLAVVYHVWDGTLKYPLVWLQWLRGNGVLLPTLYVSNDGAGPTAHIGDGVLGGASDFAQGRSSGAGDAGQALLRLGGGALRGLLRCRCALGGCLGGTGGSRSGAALREKARLPED